MKKKGTFVIRGPLNKDTAGICSIMVGEYIELPEKDYLAPPHHVEKDECVCRCYLQEVSTETKESRDGL